MLGSGTHGLQRRTRSPPPRLATAGFIVDRLQEAELLGTVPSIGCCTMNWYGMVMRWGEQELQTTRPHFLLSCQHNFKLKKTA